MFYPIMINLEKYKVLVIGGGKTSLRKVKKLLEFGADIKLISQDFLEGFDKIKNIVKEKKIFTKNDLNIMDDFNLVFATTNNKDLNSIIVNYCLDNKILVNSVTSKEASFIVPASFKTGDLSCSISTSGKAPFLSKKIKNDLKDKYSQEYIDLIYKIRKKLIEINAQEELESLLKLDYKELIKYDEKISCRDKRI